MCSKNTYVYVFSNWTPEVSYKAALEKNPATLDGLYARFNLYGIYGTYPDYSLLKL